MTVKTGKNQKIFIIYIDKKTCSVYNDNRKGKTINGYAIRDLFYKNNVNL